MDSSPSEPPGTLEWVVGPLEKGSPIPSPGDLPDPGIQLGPPALQVDSLAGELAEKPSIKELLDKGKTNLERKRDNEMKTLCIRIYGTHLEW